MSLPVWRDKIAAQIAAAQAGKHAAEARLTSEQILMTVDFAMKTYEYREVTRNLALLQAEADSQSAASRSKLPGQVICPGRLISST